MKRAVKLGTSTQVSLKLWTSNKNTTKKPLTLIKNMTSVFKEADNKTKAEKMKKYVRDQFEFFGIPAPERRSLSKEVTE